MYAALLLNVVSHYQLTSQFNVVVEVAKWVFFGRFFLVDTPIASVNHILVEVLASGQMKQSVPLVRDVIKLHRVLFFPVGEGAAEMNCSEARATVVIVEAEGLLFLVNTVEFTFNLASCQMLVVFFSSKVKVFNLILLFGLLPEDFFEYIQRIVRVGIPSCD